MAPPIAGPTLRVTLKLTLFSSTAAGTSCRGTMSPTAACQAGLLKRNAAADQEGEPQQQPGGDQAEPGTDRQPDRDQEHEQLRGKHDVAGG